MSRHALHLGIEDEFERAISHLTGVAVRDLIPELLEVFLSLPGPLNMMGADLDKGVR